MTCPFRIGGRIRPIAMFEHHRYKPGGIGVVTQIDANDRTLKASDAEGRVGRWIRWCDCESVDQIGWDWLKGELPAAALELLAAFDGLQSLTLRRDVSQALVAQAPELKARILGACEALENQKPNP
jgi:hypothetical protein